MKYVCTVCGGESQFMAHHPEAELYRCVQCTHCFSLTDGTNIKETYTEDYFKETHRNWFANPDYAYYQKLVSFLKDTPNMSSLIDLGCGNGSFLTYLHRKVPELELTGIDFSPNSLEGDINFAQGDILSKDPDVQYDAVTTLAVIEHVANVNDFLRRVKRWCRPGGTIIILTCNESGLIYYTARLLNSIGFPSAFNRLYSRHHLNHFNVKSLRTLLTNNDLLVRHTILHNMPLSAFDSPSRSNVGKIFSLFTVAILFLMGTITNRSFFQTVTCHLPEDK